MTEAIHACHGRRQGRWPIALALALLLTACGGGDGGTPATDTPATDASAVPTPAAPLAQKGFGPTELYDPATNPTGRVLQEGDTGIVFVPQAGATGAAELQVWFEIARASTYAFEMEDEDLVALTRVDVGDAAGQGLLSVDADHRLASATLPPGRYALRLIANPTNPETLPLFIRFGADEAQPKQPAAVGDLAPRTVSENAAHTIFAKACVGCDLRGANLSEARLSWGNLSGANLSGADLEHANLDRASLEGANLSGARLTRASLYEANLSRADLRSAYVMWVRLNRANLSRANLDSAILADADLRFTNLSGANLSGAYLTGAFLGEAVWVDGRTCGLNSIGQCQ